MRQFHFLLLVIIVEDVSAQTPRTYGLIGGQAVLTPNHVGPITSVTWKHETDLAMEWFGDDTISYRQFKDHGSLNISTGVMTLTGLTGDFSGIYTVEINNQINSKTELLVISPVPKPNISISCDTEKTSCVFICDGNTTGAEPVTYSWAAGEKRWPPAKDLTIAKKDKDEWFICTLENPVSSSSSERVNNPLIESTQTLMHIVIPVILVVCIIIIIILLIIVCIKCIKEGLIPLRPASCHELLSVEVIKHNGPGKDPVGTKEGVQESNQDQIPDMNTEKEPLLSKKSSNQDLTPDVTTETSPLSPEVAGKSVQEQGTVSSSISIGPVIEAHKSHTGDQEDVNSQNVINENMSSTETEAQISPTEDQEAVASQDTSNETMRPPSAPAKEETSAPATSAGPGPVTELHKSPTEDQEPADSQDVNETSQPTDPPASDTKATVPLKTSEKPESPPTVYGTSTKDTKSTAHPEDSDEPDQSTEASTEDTTPAAPPRSMPPTDEDTFIQNPSSTPAATTNNRPDEPADLPAVGTTPTQIPASTVPPAPETSNKPEMYTSTSAQEQGTGVSSGISDEPVSSTETEAQISPTEDQEAVASQDTSNETMRPPSAPATEETSAPAICAGPGPEFSTVTELHKSPTEDQEPADSQDVNETITEKPTSSPAVEETSTQDTPSAAPPGTISSVADRDKTEKGLTPFTRNEPGAEDAETSTNGLEPAVPAVISKEHETSPSGQESLGRPAQDLGTGVSSGITDDHNTEGLAPNIEVSETPAQDMKVDLAPDNSGDPERRAVSSPPQDTSAPENGKDDEKEPLITAVQESSPDVTTSTNDGHEGQEVSGAPAQDLETDSATDTGHEPKRTAGSSPTQDTSTPENSLDGDQPVSPPVEEKTPQEATSTAPPTKSSPSSPANHETPGMDPKADVNSNEPGRDREYLDTRSETYQQVCD